MNTKIPVIIGLAFLTLLIPSQAFAEFDVSLPPPLSVTDAGFEPITLPTDTGNIAIATGIDCKVKQTTQVFDQSGRLVDEIDSAGIQGSPFAQLEFTFTLGDQDIHHFSIIPKIFCSEQSGLPVEAWVKQMTISTVAQYESTNQIIDTINISQSPLAQFGSGQGEQQLANRAITSIDLEEHLPSRNLGVNYIFQITGTLNVAYTNFPQIVYQIPILWNELDTLVPTNVLKGNDPTACTNDEVFVDGACVPVGQLDNDGDGIVDNLDDCPNEPENFNGFQDTDGCPDELIAPPTCPVGTVLEEVNPNLFVCIDVVDPMNPLDCEAGDLTTNDEITCMNECLSDGNEWKIDTSTGKGFCVEPQDPTIIVNGVEPLNPEDFLTGQTIGLGRVVYKDLSQDEFLISDAGFGFGAGNITPLSVVTTIGGEQRDIERVEYEIHYRFTNTADGLATFLEDQDIRFTPTIVISSAQQVEGTTFIGTSVDLGQNAELRNNVGNTILLSKGIFLARDIQAIATSGADPAIPEGSGRTVTLRIDAQGDFTFEREQQQETFTLQDNFATFTPITINNLPDVITPVACPSGTRPTFDVDGSQIGCEPIPTDPDTDRDGIPDNQDLCPNEAGVEENGGCPAEFCTIIASCVEGAIFNQDTCRCEQDPTKPPEPVCQITEQGEEICVLGNGDNGGIIIVGGNGGDACTLTTPQFCPSQAPPIDFNQLLVIGGIAFVLIAIIVVIARRR